MTNHKHNSDARRTVAPGCAAVRDRLPGYVTLEVLGQHPSSADPLVAAHCASCAACQAELDELRALMRADDTPSQSLALPSPKWDLFFLYPSESEQAVETPSPAWQIDALGRVILRFSQALFERRQQPAFAGAMRGPSLYSFDLKLDPPHGCNVSIKIIQSKPVPEQTDRLVDVEVCVEVLSADPLDQSGSEVVVATDTIHRRDTTNLAGVTRFSDMPLRELSELRVEVLPRPGGSLPG